MANARTHCRNLDTVAELQYLLQKLTLIYMKTYEIKITHTTSGARLLINAAAHIYAIKTSLEQIFTFPQNVFSAFSLTQLLVWLHASISIIFFPPSLELWCCNMKCVQLLADSNTQSARPEEQELSALNTSHSMTQRDLVQPGLRRKSAHTEG